MYSEKPNSKIHCFGPRCNNEINKSRPWSKFCSLKCKRNYHIYKNTLIGVLSLLSKDSSLDMLENLRRRIERE